MMISRRHLADMNYRNYGCQDNRGYHDDRSCYDDRGRKCPSFLDPIDDGERLVRRPPRRTPENEEEAAMTVGQKATRGSSLHRDNVDVAKKKKKRSGILKLPPSPIESRRKVHDLPQQGQPCHMSLRESARWNAGRNLRWSEEDMERTGIGGAGGRRGRGGGGLGSDADEDIRDDLSRLANLKEQVRMSVQNRKGQKLDAEAADDESTSNDKSPSPKPEVQSCPDIRFVVDESQNHDGNHEPARRLSGSSDDEVEAVRGHRLYQPPDAARVRTRSLDHYEDRRHMPSRSRSRARQTGGDRVRLLSAGPYDRRGSSSSVCMCGCYAAMGMESPDGRRERRLMQERSDARVWQELRTLLQALPATTTSTTAMTTTTTCPRYQQPRGQASRSSSSDETLYGRRMNHGKPGAVRGRRGATGSVRDGGSALRDKMTQTEGLCRNLRTGLPRPWRKTPSVDRMYTRNLRRSSSGEKAERRSPVVKGCQAAAADRDELDVHNCDSSITEVTSIWPSTSGSGTQDGTSGAAATTSSTTDATTSCQSQESLTLLQSISVELLGSSVSSECLRAAIDATTGGQPLDENSVLDAIDREMADVNQFVRETLDVSEIKPKEYLQMHMRNLQKFTTNLEAFIAQQQQRPSTGPSSSSFSSYGSPDSGLKRM